MKKYYYAVRRGFDPGIYESWEECQRQTKGCSNASFKKFEDKASAYEFMNGEKVYRL